MEKQIMTVDDSPSIRKLVEFTLKSRGYRVLSCTDGIEALDTLSRESIDLIFLDVNMPRMDGFELLGKLRAQEYTSSIPVVMLTTEGQDEDKEKALGLGATDYIVKPFKPTELLAITSRILG